jgi:hypothetical protein
LFLVRWPRLLQALPLERVSRLELVLQPLLEQEPRLEQVLQLELLLLEQGRWLWLVVEVSPQCGCSLNICFTLEVWLERERRLEQGLPQQLEQALL